MMTKVNGELSYDQDDMIGKGGFGFVFSGFYSQSTPGGAFSIFSSRPPPTPVAVKRIQKADVKNLSKVQHEVETMIKAEDHPNILRYISTQTNNDFLFIVTELCRGTLKQYITGEGYNGPRFKNEKEILFQITQGLTHLHGLNIVHRDLKPVNILVYVPPSGGNEEQQKPPIIKLADFDISKTLIPDKEDYTNTSQTNPSGTKGWMAPEVYQSNRFDLKVDIFSLGLIFAYTLSKGNKHPFGNDPDEWAFLIKKKEHIKMGRNDLKKPYSENNEAMDLIKLMLAIDPEGRPTAKEIVNNLFFPANRQKLFESICSSFQDGIITTDNIAEFEKFLSDDSIDVDVTLKSGYTPLHILCCHYKEDNILDLVQLLVKRGANVNIKDKQIGWTPLHSLCHNYEHNNMKDIVQFLIENGADVKTLSQTGWTPLHSLFHNYNNENLMNVVQLLVETGAEVNTKTKDGWTPLHSLCYNYKNENLMVIVQLFINNGADVNAKVKDGDTLHILCHNYNNENLMDIVQLLVGRGAEVNTKNKDEWTPLHSLCYNYKNRNLLDIVQLLVERGAEVNTKNKDEWTPLHCLCRNYNNDNLMDILQLLGERGAEVNAKNKDEWTPLHCLCRNYNNDNLMDILQLLGERGAEVNTKTKDGWTPLHLLCRYYNHENLMDIIQLLVERGAEVNTKTKDEWTPLHSLCLNYKNDNLMNIVQFLIQIGARANEKNDEGSTPLHVLCCDYETDNAIKTEINLKSLISLFEEHGANLNAEDNDGKTPIDYLIRRNISLDMLAVESTHESTDIAVAEAVPITK